MKEAGLICVCVHVSTSVCCWCCAGPLVCSVLQTARRRGKKKRESLNVTLLSTVTTLATCNVSARISVAHWACAEQAPSPPRAPRKRTRWTRDELGRIPAGGRCNFNHLFFPILCYAECHHSPKLFLLLSSLFALCCPSAIKASTASHDGCRSQGAAATKRGVRESETDVSPAWETASVSNLTLRLSSLPLLYLPTPVKSTPRMLCFWPYGCRAEAIFRYGNICHIVPASGAHNSLCAFSRLDNTRCNDWRSSAEC